MAVFDLAVIGGGINGTGIARDAAGRGLSVLLAEQGDLAGATSSASTKLIHGGLRYLEQYRFRLVREALREREILLRSAPHIVWPLRFVLPHHAGLRSWWRIRLGLLLYDNLGGNLGGRRILPPARSVDLRADPAGAPLKPAYTRGFEYADCWVDDARLVVLNARDAARLGADIRTRTSVLRASRRQGVWRVTLRDGAGESDIEARALVNAAGPWVSEVLAGVVGQNAPTSIRLVKGSHIVVRRLFTQECSYIFQNADGRVCFVIPYEQNFTLIGTTDEDFLSDPRMAAITPAEEAYLLAAAGAYLRTPIDPAAIVWRYAGVRPLRRDGASAAQEATRDYVLELDDAGAPVLSVFGGKITTYRRLAEAALGRLGRFFPSLRTAWTATARLPGGDFAWDGVSLLRRQLAAGYSFIADETIFRLARSYGTDAAVMLGPVTNEADLGRHFGAGLFAREVEWLMRHEWARTAEDVLWRRGKLGLRFCPAQVAELDAWMAARGIT